MTTNILGISVEKYGKKLKLNIITVAIVIVVAVAVNIILCVLRSDATHVVFLALNILVDIAVAWFTIYYICTVISLRKKLLNIAKRIPNGERFTCNIDNISKNTVCVYGLNCFEVVGENRHFYVCEKGNIRLEAGQTVALTLVDNIVAEVEGE